MDYLINVDGTPLGRRMHLRAIAGADSVIVARRVVPDRPAENIRFADGRYWVSFQGGVNALAERLRSLPNGSRSDWIAKASELVAGYLSIDGEIHAATTRPVLHVTVNGTRVMIEALSHASEQLPRSVFRADRMEAALTYGRTITGGEPEIVGRYDILEATHFRDSDPRTQWEYREEARLLAMADSLVLDIVPAVAALSRTEQAAHIGRLLTTILDGAATTLGWSNHDRMAACRRYAADKED